MKRETLRLEQVTRIEDGVTFLDNFSLRIREGEIMGLLCINSHGQDALLQLLTANLPILYGYVYLNGQLANSYQHSDLSRNKVAVIEQQSTLVDDLTVADNIFVLRRGFKKFMISQNVLHQQLTPFLEEIGLNLNPGDLISSLSFFERCAVELLKAVITGVKLVVIRDISNFINPEDLSRFHRLMHFYAAKGISFLYVCNHHEESFTICHRISIMENGRILRVLDHCDFRDENIAPYTLDAYLTHVPGAAPASTRKSLEFDRVTSGPLNGLTFHVGKGECVALLDMSNAAFSELTGLMNGEKQLSSGQIRIAGNPLPKAVNRSRDVAFILDHPAKTMVFHEFSYLENLYFLLNKKLPPFFKHRRVKRSVIREYEPLVGSDIHCQNLRTLPPASLYDLVYYRVHLLNPKVVFCLQPFSGADMYLRHHVIQLINKLKARGIGVVILAVSISDSLMVADRLMILRNGAVAEEYDSSQFADFDRNFT